MGARVVTANVSGKSDFFFLLVKSFADVQKFPHETPYRRLRYIRRSSLSRQRLHGLAVFFSNNVTHEYERRPRSWAVVVMVWGGGYFIVLHFTINGSDCQSGKYTKREKSVLFMYTCIVVVVRYTTNKLNSASDPADNEGSA